MSEPTGFEAFWPEGVGDQVVRSFARGAWEAAVASQQAEIERLKDVSARRDLEATKQMQRSNMDIAKLSAVVEAARRLIRKLDDSANREPFGMRRTQSFNAELVALAAALAALEEKPAE